MFFFISLYGNSYRRLTCSQRFLSVKIQSTIKFLKGLLTGEALLLICAKIFCRREEQDNEYARRIQEELQRAAEEQRKREEKDEV